MLMRHRNQRANNQPSPAPIDMSKLKLCRAESSTKVTPRSKHQQTGHDASYGYIVPLVASERTNRR